MESEGKILNKAITDLDCMLKKIDHLYATDQEFKDLIKQYSNVVRNFSCAVSMGAHLRELENKRRVIHLLILKKLSCYDSEKYICERVCVQAANCPHIAFSYWFEESWDTTCSKHK